MPLFEMKNTSFYDGLTPVVNDVSLSIEKGSVTAFLGEPGGGKSTVLKLISGIVIPTKGKVFFDGKNLSAMSSRENLAFRKFLFYLVC